MHSTNADDFNENRLDLAMKSKVQNGNPSFEALNIFRHFWNINKNHFNNLILSARAAVVTASHCNAIVWEFSETEWIREGANNYAKRGWLQRQRVAELSLHSFPVLCHWKYSSFSFRSFLFEYFVVDSSSTELNRTRNWMSTIQFGRFLIEYPRVELEFSSLSNC